jgi:RNase P protein component
MANGGPLTRLGVTVTRKVCRKAVGRNRLKRLAREFFRLNRNRWPEGLDIIFIGQKNALETWPPEPLEVELFQGRLLRFAKNAFKALNAAPAKNAPVKSLATGPNAPSPAPGQKRD